MLQIELHTDGACSGNPGPGGWAAILVCEALGLEKELSGGEAETTNNRMELLAAVRGLEAIKSPPPSPSTPIRNIWPTPSTNTGWTAGGGTAGRPRTSSR